MGPHEIEEIVVGADSLAAGIRKYFIAKLADVAMSQFHGDLSGHVARFVLERQTEALRSAVVLARGSSGHLALPFVRLACEERIWVSYLFSLEREPRDQLLLLMSMLESGTAIGAQQQFFGANTMKRLGFPKSFVNEQHRLGQRSKAELSRVGRALGWPEPDGRLPSAGWIASQVKLDRLYAYLYSASSKGVHFSPSEALRSGWSSGAAADSKVTLMAEPYVNYRTAFSVYWLSKLLVETVGEIWESGPLAGVELDDEAQDLITVAVGRIGSMGQLPIVLASEYNLSTDGRAR